MTLQLEMVSCGDCKRCLLGGKVHGPYWYDYQREDGKVVSHYVGKLVTEEHADEQHPAGSTPEDLFPERAASMVQSAAEDAERREAELSEDQRANLDKVMALQANVRRASRHRARSEAPATAAQYQEEAEQLRHELGPARAALRESIQETAGV